MRSGSGLTWWCRDERRGLPHSGGNAAGCAAVPAPTPYRRMARTVNVQNWVNFDGFRTPTWTLVPVNPADRRRSAPIGKREMAQAPYGISGDGL